MQVDEFKNIVGTFADPATEFLCEKTRLVMSVNGDLLEAEVRSQSGEMRVNDGGGWQPANLWIINRLARLPLLASRLKESIPKHETDVFVSPEGKLLSSIESSPGGKLVDQSDALHTAMTVLDDRSPLETTILYLTSDAGEGKTSLINQLTRKQAERFSANLTDWLLVPIWLGGRHFLRFDDIIVGALQNKYRFQFLYYKSFLALVRMGVVVPAFDGFEEMFVESSTGEAISAMGLLVSSLRSSGAVMIATRKAYFEFENLKIQQKLYDAIRTFNVSFGKLEICRWSKSQFIEYCVKRQVPKPENLYTLVAEQLGPTHALLTRPVLVRRLIDISMRNPTLNDTLRQIQRSGVHFFTVFIRSIIEREATEKWLDRSSSDDVRSPLLSTDEHCELLALVAIEMWETRTDYLSRDLLDFTADYFSEIKKKNSSQTFQIRERLRGHALLVSVALSSQAVEFDHEEYRTYFLGIGLAMRASKLDEKAKADILGLFRKGVLPENAQRVFCENLISARKRLLITKFLLELSKLDGQTSYTNQNCSNLIALLLHKPQEGALDIHNMTFEPDSLLCANAADVSFRRCHFAQTGTNQTKLINCRFDDCTFGQIRLSEHAEFRNVIFSNCTVDSVRIEEKDSEIWDPLRIIQVLQYRGIIFPNHSQPGLATLPTKEEDPRLEDVNKVLRYFLRSTHIGESVIRIRLSNRGASFIAEQMPELVRANVFVEIDNIGASTQRRFKLGLPMTTLNDALQSARGSYDDFIRNISARVPE